MNRIVWALMVIAISLGACRPERYTPKPRGYFKISLPEHAYQNFERADFPYHFAYPVYGVVIRDSLFFGQPTENPYWINIDFPEIGGRIYISYKEVSKHQHLGKLLEDSHEMSFTVHSKRADYIEEQVFIHPEKRVYGILYHAGGNAASAYQFIATDSVKHFLRGALYFDVTPNVDSLRPANEFLKQDIIHLIESLSWQD
jgi:gliding motility-associated lipoprotein GldD